MVSWIKRLIRWAKVTRAGKDDGQFPVQQVAYNGKAADCVMVFPYGLHANVDGDALAVMLSMGGAPDNRAGLPTSMTRRSQLNSGDVELYSPVSRSRVTMRANGDVEVDAKQDLVGTVGRDCALDIVGNCDVSIGGDAAVDVGGNCEATVGGNHGTTVTGNLTATAAAATVTAPTITLDGNVFVTGGLTMSGGGAADFGTGTMTHDGKVIDSTHGHTQGNDSGGDSEAPISGVT